MVGGVPKFAAGGGGGTTGYLGTYITDAPTPGVHTGYTPTGFGAGVGRYDVDSTAGNIEFASFTAGTDGQLLNVCNIGVNVVLLDTPGFRLPGQMAIPQFDSILLCYYGGSINQWCL